MKDSAAHAPWSSGPTVTLYMPSPRNRRRFALFSTLLSEMKVHHKAIFPLFRRLKLKGYAATAMQSPYCHYSWRRPLETGLLITDQDVNNEGGKTINVTYDFMKHLKTEKQGETLFLPILFHPNILNEANYVRSSELSKIKTRPIGVLFAGNCDPEIYNNSRIQTQYGLFNRHELFQHAQTLPPDQVYIPHSRVAFDEALHNGSLANRFVWIDTGKFRIPQTEWLELLAKAQYFFCTPGVRRPYCHNLNEASACGTVPVLQYPGLYRPSLKNGENCIAYEDASELRGILQRLLTEDKTTWRARSNSAVEWHQKHMSLDHARDQIKCFLSDTRRKQMTWILSGN